MCYIVFCHLHVCVPINVDMLTLWQGHIHTEFTRQFLFNCSPHFANSGLSFLLHVLFLMQCLNLLTYLECSKTFLKISIQGPDLKWFVNTTLDCLRLKSAKFKNMSEYETTNSTNNIPRFQNHTFWIYQVLLASNLKS